MDESLKENALEYHKLPKPGKIEITPTTPLETQKDLSLAYSPGVAAPCLEIEKDPSKVTDYTARGNMVAVISNGTAVLGLGNIGALAAKPVMEGKCVLFKKFANIDAIDIEVDEKNIDEFVETVARLEPSFGGINLEDIKAPECFEIERRLRERMNIPVFHDDQHGTAIIVTAAFRNWLHYTGKKAQDVKLVTSGAGAAAIACLTLLVESGLPKENIILCDSKGVVYKGRSEGMNPQKEQFATDTTHRTIGDAMKGANAFLGLSGPGLITKDMIRSMDEAPLVMTLANPTPEIMPEDTKEAKPDAVICTGRSDYPNQVNNVLGFPYIFKGALDVAATSINEEMKLACVDAIAMLARKEAPEEVATIYAGESLEFGPEYLIPKPFDPRLIVDLPCAVAKAAMETGVATRPIEDFEKYASTLEAFFFRTTLVMRPLFTKAKANPKRVAYCDGEEEKTLRAVQIVIDDGLAKPIVIGRHDVVQTRIKRMRLRMEIDKDFELVDPEKDRRFRDYWQTYHTLMERKGVTPTLAKSLVRTKPTIIGALMVHKGDADAVICGTVGNFNKHLKHIVDIIGLRPDVKTVATMNGMLLNKGMFFMSDTYVNANPTAEELCEITMLAAEKVKRFGIAPKIALVSHSNFGSHRTESAEKMRKARTLIQDSYPDLEVDGEMNADAALCEKIRDENMPNTTLSGAANLLIMPDVDSANISFNMLKVLGDGLPIGPILLGTLLPAHVLTPAATVRAIVNMSAYATVSAQIYEDGQEYRF